MCSVFVCCVGVCVVCVVQTHDFLMNQAQGKKPNHLSRMQLLYAWCQVQIIILNDAAVSLIMYLALCSVPEDSFTFNWDRCVIRFEHLQGSCKVYG